MPDNTYATHDAARQDKTATTLELFFDLVFVFAITQVVYGRSTRRPSCESTQRPIPP